jgi:hypothetical protein
VQGAQTVRAILDSVSPDMQVEVHAAVVRAWVAVTPATDLPFHFTSALAGLDDAGRSTVAAHMNVIDGDELRERLDTIADGDEHDDEHDLIEQLSETFSATEDISVQRNALNVAADLVGAAAFTKNGAELTFATVLPLLSASQAKQLSDEVSEIYCRDHQGSNN